LKLRALIFDVDGTLADTEEAHRCAFNEAFQQLGVNWNWSKPVYAHLLRITGGKERMAAYIESLNCPPAERSALTACIDDIHRAKTRNYTRMVLAGEVPLRDGVDRLLDDAARSRVRLSIASTTTFANIEALLRANLGPEAIDRFEVIGAGDQVARKKPAADIYDHVLRSLKATADECVAIEDSRNGLRAAKGAGLYTVVTPSYWTNSEDFSEADLVLPSLGSLERPLPPRAVSLVGNTVLGIRELDRQLNAIRECD
jgi:beta-phosphoglucomutase-like phosphatase (HAD superfamily)